MKRQKERAQSPQRPLDLATLKAFWDTVSQNFPGLRIDLSLFDYKAGEFNKPKVSKEDYARVSNIPVEEAYDNVIKLLPEYHAGKDILWKPSDYYKGHKEELVSLVWLDDFKLDNALRLTPLLYIQTSLGKYQAFFKLSEPATVEDADAIQKEMAKILGLGDKSAGSFFQHRRMAGLANGKYEDDPLVIFTVPETPSPISIKDIKTSIEEEEEGVAGNNATGTEGHEEQGTKGQSQASEGQAKNRTKGLIIYPVVPANYKPVVCKDRDEFIKRKPDGTIDESATDMAWAVHLVRRMTRAGWDETAIALTVFFYLGQKSPELKRRKKTNDHALDYLFRTVWKAIDLVKKTPDKEDRGKDEEVGGLEAILDSF
jgi:hypothetical protein